MITYKDMALKAEVKGQYMGVCNISSCTTHEEADYYNHGSRKYYCKSCAMRLNADEFNKRDAQRLFGHELCTLATTPHI